MHQKKALRKRRAFFLCSAFGKAVPGAPSVRRTAAEAETESRSRGSGRRGGAPWCGAPANAGTATRKGPAACSGGQKRCNGADLRKARKPEVQIREPEFLGNRVLCQYGGLQQSSSRRYFGTDLFFDFLGRASCHPSREAWLDFFGGAEMRQKNLYIAIHAVNRQFVLKTPRAAPEKL